MSILSCRTSSAICLVRQPGDVAPLVGRQPEPLGDGIRIALVGIAEDFEAIVIVRGDHRLAEKADRMFAKMRGEIADPQSAFRLASIACGAAAAESGSACRSAQAKCSANKLSRHSQGEN